MDGIKEISIRDKNYPELLKKINDAPQVLYVKGELKPKEHFFAVVGTRLATAYGKETAWQVASDLADTGLTVVSGLAPGIDTYAHQAVVEKNKRTVAVLGTGLDEKSIYPQSNLKLAEKILAEGGCLISEYPPGTRGTNFTFPKRNRIISGLSLGVLVIEAKEKSGALITADSAKKQGRIVFAVPGSIYSSNSRGPHSLIKKGAKLIESANDILKELNLNLLTYEINGLNALGKGANQEEKLILNALGQGALYVDKIIEITKLSAAEVMSTLAVLEIKNKVKNLGENIYAIGHC